MTLHHNCRRFGCFKDQLIPDWGFLNGCFPRNIAPSDIDALRHAFTLNQDPFLAQPDDLTSLAAVEQDLKFLILEWKSGDPAGNDYPSYGQELMLRRIGRQPNFTVLELRGPIYPEQHVIQMRVLKERDTGWVDADERLVRDWVKVWSGHDS